MDIRQLRHFIAVAEEKNYRVAAERLHMTQPPLSLSIKKLETDLGVILLDRSRKHVDLTTAGALFLEGAYETLAKLEQLTNDTQRAAKGLAGRLNIAFTGSAIYDVLPKSVRRFSRQFPEVELELFEMTTIEQLDAITHGNIDAGFLRPPVAGSSLYHLDTVQKERLIAVMPDTHPLAKAPKIKLTELATDGFILFPIKTSPNLHALVLLACREAGFTPRISQSASQIQTQISLVSAGLGVALVPECVQKAAHQGVVYKQIDSPSDHITTRMSVATRQGHNNKLLDAFLDVCREMNAVVS